jgi:hypothetical protein
VPTSNLDFFATGKFITFEKKTLQESDVFEIRALQIKLGLYHWYYYISQFSDIFVLFLILDLL